MKTVLLYITTIICLSLVIWLSPKLPIERNPEGRKILSTLYFNYSDVLDFGFQVIKFQKNNSVYVDIYKIFPSGKFELLQQIKTGNRYDGYFLIGDNAVNLALADIDEDQRLDILIPGFDKNLVAYLNILRFDLGLNSFELVNDLSIYNK